MSGGPHGDNGAEPAGLTLAVDGNHVTVDDHGRGARAVITVDPAHAQVWFDLTSHDGGR